MRSTCVRRYIDGSMQGTSVRLRSLTTSVSISMKSFNACSRQVIKKPCLIKAKGAVGCRANRTFIFSRPSKST